jgi:hypothetical protein
MNKIFLIKFCEGILSTTFSISEPDVMKGHADNALVVGDHAI